MSLSNIAFAQVTNTPAIQSATTALAANPGRVGLFIQNLGQNPLFVRFGLSASSTVFNIVLAAGTANDNGTGGSYDFVGPLVYSGIVTIAGTSPRYTITEFTENHY